MPPPRDLTGQRFGSLYATGRAGHTTYGGKRQAVWACACDCGATEAIPQSQLVSGRVAACSNCRRPPCSVCGRPVPLDRPRSNTCDEGCALAKRRATDRDHYYRRAQSPSYNAERHQRRLAQVSADPDALALFQATERRRRDREKQRLASNPELQERKRNLMRAWYAQNAARVQGKRRARLDRMTAEEFARWEDRMRTYQRAWRRRWRADIAADPLKYQQYLDRQREWARQRALRGLFAIAETLEKRLDDDN